MSYSQHALLSLNSTIVQSSFSLLPSAVEEKPHSGSLTFVSDTPVFIFHTHSYCCFICHRPVFFNHPIHKYKCATSNKPCMKLKDNLDFHFSWFPTEKTGMGSSAWIGEAAHFCCFSSLAYTNHSCSCSGRFYEEN